MRLQLVAGFIKKKKVFSHTEYLDSMSLIKYQNPGKSEANLGNKTELIICDIHFVTLDILLGYVSVKAICLRDQNTQVNSSFCSARTKPATEPQICSAFSCPA